MRKDTKTLAVIVKPEVGATATILVLFLKKLYPETPWTLATALTYAISSETKKQETKGYSLRPRSLSLGLSPI